MQRLLQQVRDRQAPGAAPGQAHGAPPKPRFGALYFGSTSPAMHEALDALEARGIDLDTLRIRAFPFHDEVLDFIADHERVFVVEQNRDAQLRTLLMNEGDDRPGAAGADPALRRHADHRALHRQGDRRHARRRHPRPAERRRSRDLHHQAPLHHPQLPTNALGYTRRDYEGAVSTLCAGCGHDSISAAIIQACFELEPAAAPDRQALRHRLLVEDADLLPRQVARLQQRARPHAVGADRRQSRQSRADLSRRLGRRRFGLDRPRPVRPLHPPRRQHGLYRREQRRLRPDQGPVLGDRGQGLEGASAAPSTPIRRSTS